MTSGGKEFHNRDYIVHSPHQSGTFSDNTDDDREFVRSAKEISSHEDIWGEEDDVDEDGGLDVDEYESQQQKRSIPVTVNYHPLTKIDPRYEERIPEMSRTDKNIVTSLSQYWIERGVIQRTDGDHGMETDEDVVDMISSAEQAAQQDEELNPGFATADAKIIRHISEDHYSEEVGVNPFEDYDYEEDSAIESHKKEQMLAEQARKDADAVDTQSMVLSEDARAGMQRASREFEVDESEFLHSSVEVVDSDGWDDTEYSASIEELTAEANRSYERADRLYSGQTRRLATDLDDDDDDYDYDFEEEDYDDDAESFEAIDGDDFNEDSYQGEDESASNVNTSEFKRIAKYADDFIRQYESEEADDEKETPAVSSRKPRPRSVRSEPKRGGRISSQDRPGSEDSADIADTLQPASSGGATAEDTLSVKDTVMVMKLIQKGLDNEDIVDVVGNVSIPTVESLRRSIS